MHYRRVKNQCRQHSHFLTSGKRASVLHFYYNVSFACSIRNIKNRYLGIICCLYKTNKCSCTPSACHAKQRSRCKKTPLKDNNVTNFPFPVAWPIVPFRSISWFSFQCTIRYYRLLPSQLFVLLFFERPEKKLREIRARRDKIRCRRTKYLKFIIRFIVLRRLAWSWL